MSVATQEKPKTDVAEFHRDAMTAAMVGIRKMANDEPLSLDDNEVFSLLNWDRERIAMEVNRETRLRNTAKMAGTNDAFAAAQKRQAHTSGVVKDKTPGLESKIVRLQNEIAAIHGDAFKAEQAVEDMAEARKQIRGLIPSHISQFCSQLRSQAKGNFVPAISELEQALIQIESGNQDHGAMPEHKPGIVAQLESLKQEFEEALVDAEKPVDSYIAAYLR